MFTQQPKKIHPHKVSTPFVKPPPLTDAEATTIFANGIAEGMRRHGVSQRARDFADGYYAFHASRKGRIWKLNTNGLTKRSAYGHGRRHKFA